MAVDPDPRTPRYVSRKCVPRATSADGRRVAFFNRGVSGGCVGRYAVTGAEDPSRECFIHGVRCQADERRFGGTVIQAVG